MIASAYVNRPLTPHLLTTTTAVVSRHNLWPPQPTAADAHTELGHPDNLVASCILIAMIRTLHVPEPYQTLHNQPVQLLHREEELRYIKLSPLSTLHGSWWRRGVSLRGSSCRATCILRCAPWSAMGERGSLSLPWVSGDNEGWTLSGVHLFGFLCASGAPR